MIELTSAYDKQALINYYQKNLRAHYERSFNDPYPSESFSTCLYWLLNLRGKQYVDYLFKETLLFGKKDILRYFIPYLHATDQVDSIKKLTKYFYKLYVLDYDLIFYFGRTKQFDIIEQYVENSQYEVDEDIQISIFTAYSYHNEIEKYKQLGFNTTYNVFIDEYHNEALEFYKPFTGDSNETHKIPKTSTD